MKTQSERTMEKDNIKQHLSISVKRTCVSLHYESLGGRRRGLDSFASELTTDWLHLISCPILYIFFILDRVSFFCNKGALHRKLSISIRSFIQNVLLMLTVGKSTNTRIPKFNFLLFLLLLFCEIIRPPSRLYRL